MNEVYSDVEQKKKGEKTYKIIIKTEASEQIGLGHIKRMIVFGQFLNENKKNGVVYAINKNEIAKNNLEEAGYLFAYDFEYGESEQELIAIIKKQEPDILIIDVQKFDGETNYNFENIKKQTGIKKIVLVDKYAENDFVDLMIIQGIQEDEFEEKGKKNSKVLFGLDCIFINTVFLKAKAKRENKPKKNEKEIVISFGGTDTKNLTVKVINQVKNVGIKFNASFKIILGPYYKNHVELYAALRDFKYKYQIIENPKNYADQLINTDYAIGAYGVSYYEFLYMNIPTANFVINDQDVNILDKLIKMGMAFRLEEILANPNIVLELDNADVNGNKMEMIYNHLIKKNK